MDKNKKVPETYGVSAMPTLVITEADGTELAKAVGAPFSTPEAAIKWFDGIGADIQAYLDLRIKWDETKHSGADIGEKFAEAALKIGRRPEAVRAYESLIEVAGEDKARVGALKIKLARLALDDYDVETAAARADEADKLLPAEGDARVDLDLLRARILLWSEKPEESRKLCEKYYDTLLKAADARVIDLAEVYLGTESSDDEAATMKKGREMYLALAKTFPKHERVWELKVYAAWYGSKTDQRDASKKELAEIAEKGEGQWKDIAKQVLEQIEAEEKEGSDEGDDMDG